MPAPTTPELIAQKTQEKFNLLPISCDEENKHAKPLDGYSDPLLNNELKALNNLHDEFDKLLSDDPPSLSGPRRLSEIVSSCEQGIKAYARGNYAEAITYYTQSIKIVHTRPQWESANMFLYLLEQLYRNRAQAHVWFENWPEGLADAEASITFNKESNVKAHVWKAYCLQQMGRLDEARDALLYAAEFGPHHAADPTLVARLNTLTKMIDERDNKPS